MKIRLTVFASSRKFVPPVGLLVPSISFCKNAPGSGLRSLAPESFSQLSLAAEEAKIKCDI